MTELHTKSPAVRTAQREAMYAFGIEYWQVPIGTSATPNPQTVETIFGEFRRLMQTAEEHDPVFYALGGQVLRELDPQFRTRYAAFEQRVGRNAVLTLMGAMKLLLEVDSFNMTMGQALTEHSMEFHQVDPVWTKPPHDRLILRARFVGQMWAVLKFMKDFRGLAELAEAGTCTYEWPNEDRYQALFEWLGVLHPQVANSRASFDTEATPPQLQVCKVEVYFDLPTSAE